MNLKKNIIMNIGEIKILTRKYLDGDTTLEEEMRLKALYTQEDIPRELLPLRDYFLYVESIRGESISDPDFNKDLNRRIEEETSIIPISRRKRILWIGGIAAGILILITVLFQVNRFMNRVEDTYSNPELAYQEAKKILYYVSNQFNKGTEDLTRMKKLDSGLEALQPVDKINKGFEEANKLKKYNQIEKVFTTSN